MQIHIRSNFRIIPVAIYATTALFLIYLILFDTASYFYVFSGITLYFLTNYVIMIISAMFSLCKVYWTENKSFDLILNDIASTRKSNHVIHYVIIPNYKEPIEVLAKTLESLTVSTICKEQICVCLAMEERDPTSTLKADTLIKRYSYLFKEMFYSTHPSDIEGEQAGKGSNGEYACRMVEKRYIQDGRSQELENMIFTLTDADTTYNRQFFEALTYEYISHPDRHQTFFQTPMISFLNILKIPFATRILAIMGAINELSRLSNPLDCTVTYSCYSVSFNFWKSFGGFDTFNVADDLRACIKGFIYTNGKSRVHPIYLPTLNYCVEGVGFWDSLWSKFEQAQRHAWGISEFSTYIQDISERGLYNYLGSVSQVFYFFKLTWRLFDGHWGAAIGILFANISGLIYNYFYRVEPILYGDLRNKDASFQILAAGSIWIQMNTYLIISQVGFIFLALILINKYANRLKWWYIPCIIIEYFVLSMPAVLMLGCIPTWMGAIKLAFTDRFSFVTSKKNVLERDESCE